MVYFDAGNVAFGDGGSAMRAILGLGTHVQADRQPKPNTENQGIQRQLHMGSNSPVVIRLHSASHGPCICWAQPLHLIGKFCKIMNGLMTQNICNTILLNHCCCNFAMLPDTFMELVWKLQLLQMLVAVL